MTQKYQPVNEHTPLPWYHRQAFQKSRYGEAFDWVADHPEYGQHHKIIIPRGSCKPADYALIVQAVNSYAAMRTALEIIRDWQNVRIADEHEHSLRDIIRSITDCADRALATGEAGGTLK